MLPDITYAALSFAIALFSLLAVVYTSFYAYCLVYRASNDAITKFIKDCKFPIKNVLSALSISREDFSHYPDNTFMYIITNTVQRGFFSIFSIAFIIAISRFIIYDDHSSFDKAIAFVMLLVNIFMLLLALRFGYRIKYYINNYKEF